MQTFSILARAPPPTAAFLLARQLMQNKEKSKSGVRAREQNVDKSLALPAAWHLTSSFKS